MSAENNKRMSWTKLANELDKMDVRTLKLACKGIQRKLDKLAERMGKKSNYRVLHPPQIKLIKKHLGYL